MDIYIKIEEYSIMKEFDSTVQRFNFMNMVYYSKRNSVSILLVKVGFVIGIQLLVLNQIVQILAQDEKINIDGPLNMNNNVTDDPQNLKVSFDSIKINNDHDLLYEGEWKIDVYVNGKKIPLLSNFSMLVESGQTVVFPKEEKFTNIQIMNNQTLRIVTLGIEYDSKTDQIKNYLPDISSILDNDNVPLSEDRDKSRFGIEPFTAFDRNDAIGIVAKEFTSKDNFGIGLNHDYCSESSGEAGDIYDLVDTNCDFQLRFSIELNNKIEK
jgi:hypothetical protein